LSSAAPGARATSSRFLRLSAGLVGDAVLLASTALAVAAVGRTEGGFEVVFHGEYREIVTNERLVYTEVYEGAPEGEAVDTMTFTEQRGRTSLTILMQFTRQEHRDAVIDSGMEAGMQDAMDLLEQVAVSLS